MNKKVQTKLGTGVIICKELNVRYLIKLDNCPDDLIYLHNKYGGLYFWKCEVKVIKE